MKSDNTNNLLFDTHGCYDLTEDTSQTMIALTLGVDIQDGPSNYADQFFALATSVEAIDIMTTEAAAITEFISL